MTGLKTNYCQGCKDRQDRIKQLEAQLAAAWDAAIEAQDRELTMTALANTEASSEWIDGFEHAWKRANAALREEQP